MGPREVAFGAGRRALLLTADHRPAADLVAALGLDPPGAGRPVIVVCGGAGNLTGTALDRARDLIEHAVAPVAAATGAAIVDGGTSSGVMRLTGAARSAQPDRMPVLVGVAPAGLVSYPEAPPAAPPDGMPLDAGHTHFVLADSDRWGGETPLLMATAQALAGSGRVAVVVGGGGPVTQAEVAEAQRRGWPILAVTGTGGVADSIAARTDVRRASDPVDGARQLSWELRDEPALKDAWQQFATYDQLAKRLRGTFTRLLGWTLALGVTATLLALLGDQIGGARHWAALHWAVVVAPLLVAALIAVSGRQSFGQRWVLLRAAAESVKAEIYRYRALAAAGPADGGDQATLVSRLTAIEGQLMRTEAGREPLTPYRGPLPPAMYPRLPKGGYPRLPKGGSPRLPKGGNPAGPGDDGLSALDPAGYLRVRVDDQVAYYHGRVRMLDRRRSALYLFAVAAGLAGGIVAAADGEIWVSLTSGASAASLAYLGYLQFDSTIVAFNQAAARLAGLSREWRALRPAQQTPETFERLVVQCEAALATEQASWVLHQNDALAEVAARQDGG